MGELNALHRAWPHRDEIQPPWMSSTKVLAGNGAQHVALPSLWGRLWALTGSDGVSNDVGNDTDYAEVGHPGDSVLQGLEHRLGVAPV